MVNLDKLYSVKLEHHLIAGLINNPDVFPEIDPFLNEEHFGNDTNKSLYRVVKDIILSGKETDAVIIAQKVKDSCRRHNISTKDDIDIFDYVDSLANIKISAKGVKETVDELIRKKVQRDFYFTANNILEYIGKSGGDSSDEIIRNTEKIFGDKVSHYNFTETPKHILKEVVSEIEERMKNPVEETGLKTPYSEFNRLYGGLRTGNLYCFCSRPAVGKALEENTLIPTPTGWSKIKDLTVGDYVFAPDGTPTRILATQKWENRDVFKVIIDDNNIILADSEHEWMIHSYRKPGLWQKLTTEKIYNYLQRQTRKPRLKLPDLSSLQLNDVELPIDPYLLGLWLGDGTAENSRITCLHSDAEFYIKELKKRKHDLIRRDYSKYCYFVPGLITLTRKNNLYKNKHIPKIYLRASEEQRLDLLCGLMDTDGFINKKRGQCSFTNTNKKIIDGTLELIRSLGVKAFLTKQRFHSGYGYKQGYIYRITFHYNNCFLLPRKRGCKRIVKHRKNNYISVEKTNEKKNTFCIQVEHPSKMFLCGESMIPTCNSTILNDIAIKVPVLNNCKTLVLDTEMSGEEMMFRLASSISGVPLWYLETGNVSKYPKYKKLWEENKGKIKEYEKLYTHFSVPGKKVEEIESIIRRWYYKEVGTGNVGIVIYDYIKLTGEKDFNKQEYQLIGEKVSKLKDLSAKLNIPILTACQLNRIAEEKRNDNTSIAQSDRLSWFASGVWIFRRKWQEEIQEEGEDFGTHKLIEIKTRFQGKDAKGHNTLIRVLDHMDHNNKPKYKYLNNYINFKVENFRVEEKGSLETILKRKQEKYEIQKKESRDDIL